MVRTTYTDPRYWPGRAAVGQEGMTKDLKMMMESLKVADRRIRELQETQTTAGK
jgi:hypothetical protein